MSKKGSGDVIASTPQWAAYCANEKGKGKPQMPDFVVDKRTVVVDPVSKKKFYKCRMVSESEIYYEIKNMLL